MADFTHNPRGGLTVDRDSLHASPGYARQVEAAKQLQERKVNADVEKAVECPCCGKKWPLDCEQHACIELFGECIVCRFMPDSRGSRSGTTADMDAITGKRHDRITAHLGGEQ